MFKAEKLLILSLLLPLFPSYSASAQVKQGVVGKLGLGTTGAFNFPISGLGKRFRAAETLGVLLAYAKGPRSTIEVEYHRNRYDPGKLQEDTFYWPQEQPDKWKRYRSPLARNFMVVDAFTVNGMYHLVDRAPAGSEGLQQRLAAGPYIMYGGGFYHYTYSVSGLIFAGQPDLGKGLDDTLLMEPFKDTDVGWGFHLGGGVEVVMNDTAAFDIRARYHTIIGELRQMDAYNVERAYPLFYFDLGFAVKFYFARL